MPGGKRDILLTRLFFGGLLAAVTVWNIDGQAKSPYPVLPVRISHDERMRRMKKLRDHDKVDIGEMYGDQAAADLTAWEQK
jgi:hypothetical protein